MHIAYAGLAAALLALLFVARHGYLKRRRVGFKVSKCPIHWFLGIEQKSAPAPATQPGLGWQEAYLDGSQESEAAFIKRAMREIQIVQTLNMHAAKAPAHSRAFHAKMQAGIDNAEFRVLDTVPEQFRVGLFQPGKCYPAAVRLSNAAGVCKADTSKDLRGLALRITADGGKQDFLSTNGSASHARDARQFMEFAKATAGSKLLLLPRLIWYLGIAETVRIFKTVIRQVSRPINSLCTETYYSRSPYALGPNAFKFQFSPADSASLNVTRSDTFLRDEIVERLKHGPVVFNFQVQLYLDEKRTPIEDGSKEWDSPLITVAQLVIPQQDLSTEAAAASQRAVEDYEFNPWHCTPEVRPLGSLNRARRLVYQASVEKRKGDKGNGGTGGASSSTSHSTEQDDSMTEENSKQGQCPFRKLSNPSLWRPRSSRVGIGPLKYVYWNAFYWVMETLNRGLSRNPFRKVSWDKWPPVLGLLYLIAKIRYNRSNALTDPYDYATNDTKQFGNEPEAAKHGYLPDGSWTLDRENPQMGTPNTRFGSNIPPKKVRPDVEKMEPSAREVGKLRWRRVDPETGREIVIPAMILNDLAGGWIQFQFHNFGGNTKRDPVGVCPHMLARRPDENWPGNVAIVDRTSADPTRVTENGRPTVINEKVVAWIQGQLYGSDENELNPLRSFTGGKMRLDENQRLPEDPKKPGIDQTGFNNNFNPLLSFLHWLFVSEHNAIAEHYAYFHPDWDDEKLFQMARKVNVAQIARIHTIMWTEDLLQHPTLQMGMHADWYGLIGQKIKMKLMRLSARHPFINWLLTPLRHNDFVWGMVGSKWEHHDGPFQLPKHFRMVYRLHEMVLSEHDIHEPGSDRMLDRIQLIDFIHHNTRPIVAKYGYETLAWSFVRKSCGALTLHNFPRALTQFENQQDGTLTDLAERDIFRERTDGTGTYNEFRMSVGEPPVTSFMELTGGDAELARELELKYEGDVDKVDAGIGILAEPKPAGFALGFCQFYQFVLNAPRRVKSNRHLTEGFTYAEYQEGMDWVEHGGGMLGAMARHLPGIRAQMEGVTRAFTPWPETETFPLRLLNKTHEDTAKVHKSDLRSIVLGAAAAGVAIFTGAVSVTTALLLFAALATVPTLLTVRRMLAMRFMQLCWKKCYTDKRAFMFGTLTRAEHSLCSAGFWGRMHAIAVMAVGGFLAVHFFSGSALLGGLSALVALNAICTYKWSNAFAADAQLLKIALRNRMREGQPFIPAESLPGKTAAEKRSFFAQSAVANARLNKSNGDADMDEFERMFKMYAPGRDYLTVYDFDRMHEGDRVQYAKEGRGNWFSRKFHELYARRWSAKLIAQFGDRTVEEDRKLVPAISREMLLAYIQGSAQAQLKQEHEEGDRDPSPVIVRN